MDSLEVTRRLVDEHRDQDTEYPLDSLSSSILSKTLDNIGTLTHASITAAQYLLEQMRKLEKNKLLSLKMLLMRRGRSDRLTVSEESVQLLEQLDNRVRTLMAESTDKSVTLDLLREIDLFV